MPRERFGIVLLLTGGFLPTQGCPLECSAVLRWDTWSFTIEGIAPNDQITSSSDCVTKALKVKLFGTRHRDLSQKQFIFRAQICLTRCC